MTLAISVHAPFAWALLYGGKPLENRAPSFPMRFRGESVLGDVWLHASLWPGSSGRLTRGQITRMLDERESMIAALFDAQGWPEPHAIGAEAGIILERLGRTPAVQTLDAMRGHIVGRIRVTGYRDPDDPPDSRWYVPGSRAVLVEDPRPLATPVPARGALGWWRVPADVLEQLRRAE